MNSVILNRNELDRIIYALDKLIKNEMVTKYTTPNVALEVKENLNNIKKLLNGINLENSIEALHSPIQIIVSEIIEIVEDGKINIKDIGNLSSIVNQLFRLRKLTPGIRTELSSLTRLEVQILASEIAGAVYDNLTEVKK